MASVDLSASDAVTVAVALVGIAVAGAIALWNVSRQNDRAERETRRSVYIGFASVLNDYDRAARAAACASDVSSSAWKALQGVEGVAPGRREQVRQRRARAIDEHRSLAQARSDALWTLTTESRKLRLVAPAPVFQSAMLVVYTLSAADPWTSKTREDAQSFSPLGPRAMEVFLELAAADVRTPGATRLSKSLSDQWSTIAEISEALREHYPTWNFARDRGRLFWKKSIYALTNSELS